MNIKVEITVIRNGKVSSKTLLDVDAGKSKGKTFQYVGAKADTRDIPGWAKVPISIKPVTAKGKK